MPGATFLRPASLSIPQCPLLPLKQVNQLLAGVHIAAAAEAMALGARVGLDTAELFQIISNAAGASWMFCDRVPRMLAGAEDNPRSALDIFVKDLGIVLSEGLRTKFPLPITASAHQLFLQVSILRTKLPLPITASAHQLFLQASAMCSPVERQQQCGQKQC